MMTTRRKLEIIGVVIIFICLYGFLLKIIPWSLIFSPSTVSGGDTGSHNYVAWYSRMIFPKLKWWSPDWYAGFPFLYFYPPLCYYLTNILSFAVSFNIAFKLITLLGSLLLPLSVYLCLRLLDFHFPIPSFATILSLSFLFLEKFSIYGGNIPSTLSGEFSYSLGFSLFFIFIGCLFRATKERKFEAWALLFLTLMVLAHPFSVIVAALTAGLMLLGAIITKQAKKTFWLLLKTFGLAFSLTAFWSLPFMALLNYTSKMSWTKVINVNEIFPPSLIGFEIIAGIALIYALIKKDKKILPLVYIAVASSVPFYLLNHSSIWNTRFLPFMLMTALMIAGYGLGSWCQELGKLLTKKQSYGSMRRFFISFFLLTVFSLCFLIIYLPSTISYIPFWMKWNYEGFENKAPWPEINQLFSYLKTLPQARIMWEYRNEYDKFGTPRILENLPVWTNQPTFEGLLIESSISGYFHFINQTETTQTPTSAIAGMDYPSFNFENGAKHLQIFGSQYFIAYTPEIKALAGQYFEKLRDVGEFGVYQIPNAPMVEILTEIKLRPKTSQWLDESIDWYQNMDFDQFLVFYQNKNEFKEITSAIQKKSGAQEQITIKEIKKDSLVFETKNLNQPHLIKISYFPGWKARGAQGPYLISPAFMMVIPTQEEVTLEFGYNIWDKIGMAVSIITFLGIVLFPAIQKLSRSVSAPKQKPLIPQS